MEPHAQEEIRKYAFVIVEEIVSKWVPVVWEAFLDFHRYGHIEVVRCCNPYHGAYEFGTHIHSPVLLSLQLSVAGSQGGEHCPPTEPSSTLNIIE
jgi:thymidylate synthase ThyX